MSLIDDLRLIGCHSNGDSRCTCVIGNAAADELERLRGERDALRQELDRVVKKFGAPIGYVERDSTEDDGTW